MAARGVGHIARAEGRETPAGSLRDWRGHLQRAREVPRVWRAFRRHRHGHERHPEVTGLAVVAYISAAGAHGPKMIRSCRQTHSSVVSLIFTGPTASYGVDPRTFAAANAPSWRVRVALSEIEKEIPVMGRRRVAARCDAVAISRSTWARNETLPSTRFSRHDLGSLDGGNGPTALPKDSGVAFRSPVAMSHTAIPRGIRPTSDTMSRWPGITSRFCRRG
jgi:hypothetical protein